MGLNELIGGVGSFQPLSKVSESTLEESTGRVERKKWVALEDIVLCSAWLNTSKDAVVGNEQKHNAFWKRVGAYFNASPKLEGYKDRDASNCKQRWHKINYQVSKFVGCYDAARRQQTSGQNEKDIMKMAYEIFCQDEKVKFNLEHAWLELRYDQKWCSSIVKGGSNSKRKTKDEAFSSSNTTKECDEQESRPEGVKAAKRKGKRSMKDGAEGESQSLIHLQQVWGIRDKDHERKERVSKLGLLTGLISKTEPLSDMEKSLKDKLIAEML